VWHPLIAGNFIRSPGAALIRRSHLSRVGLWDPAPEIRGNEDWDMWIRLAESGPFVRVEEPLFQYRVHGSSMSTNEILRLHWSTLFLYRKHLQCNQKDPERLCRVAHAYQKANKQTYKRWLAQAYADRSRGDARAALAKAARVLGMHPGYLLDKDFIRFFLGTWKRAWKMSPVPHPPRSSGAAR
jgi:GT2 family glycosyltransferase